MHFLRQQISLTEVEVPEFHAWANSLPFAPTEVFDKTARAIVAERQSDFENKMVDCADCAGDQYRVSDCDCMQGGCYHYDDEQGVGIRERSVGEVNPDCLDCAGMGLIHQACSGCDGTGQTILYPKIELINQLTGEQQTILLDVAALIIANPNIIRTELEASIDLESTLIGKARQSFGLHDHTMGILRELGLDPDNSMLQNEQYMCLSSDLFADLPITGSQWRDGRIHALPMRRSTEIRDVVGMPTTQQRIEDLQKLLAKNYAPRAFGTKYIEGAATHSLTYSAYPIRSFEETLSDLKTSLDIQGCVLGYTLSGIATEEVAPSFYLMGKSGELIGQLGVDYDVRMALERAWLEWQDFNNNRPYRPQ